MLIPVHIGKGIPPELMSDTDMDAGLQQANQPIEVDTKEEGECTDQDDQDMPPLEDESTDETLTKTFPPDPWNDSAFTLQDRLDQEERRSKTYADFSPQEYECLRDALGLITVNKHLDLEKAMKVLQWFKQSTCPCNQHVIGRGGNQWQLRPSTTVPPEVVLQLPTVSNSTILKRRAVKQIATDQASLAVETSSIQSDGTYLQDEPVTKDQFSDTLDNTFNKKMKKMFQNPVLQNLFPHEQTLNELCSKILKDVKQANPLK